MLLAAIAAVISIAAISMLDIIFTSQTRIETEDRHGSMLQMRVDADIATMLAYGHMPLPARFGLPLCRFIYFDTLRRAMPMPMRHSHAIDADMRGATLC